MKCRPAFHLNTGFTSSAYQTKSAIENDKLIDVAIRTANVIAPKRVAILDCVAQNDLAGLKSTSRFFHAIDPKFNRRKSRHLFLDMREIEFIEILCLPILAAHIEARRIMAPGTIDGYYPNSDLVTFLMESTGFSELLGFNPAERDYNVTGFRDVFSVEFKSGRGNQNEAIPIASLALSNLVETQIPESGIILANRVGDAIKEALLNISQHAYDSKQPGAKRSKDPVEVRLWWALSHFDREEKTLTLSVYDRGVGIPGTLDRSWFSVVDEVLNPSNHSDCIRAALEYGKSSVRSPERGKGLAEMRALVDEVQNSNMLVMSGHGVYVARRKNGETTELSTSLPTQLNGTLIAWTLKFGEYFDDPVS